MDHDGWYGYVYPKNLGAHDRPKLGCAATVARLEIAADPDGHIYFHNVRVNGILLRDDASSERGAFLSWLEGVLEASLSTLRGSTRLASYDQESPAALLAALKLHRARLAQDPEARSFRELFGRELEASQERLRALRSDVASLEQRVDDTVYDLYGIESSLRALVDAEYG